MSYTLGIISILQSIRRIMCSTCVKERHGVLNIYCIGVGCNNRGYKVVPVSYNLCYKYG